MPSRRVHGNNPGLADRVWAQGGLILGEKAGSVSDSDVPDAQNSMVGQVDTTNNRLYVKINGTWRYLILDNDARLTDTRTPTDASVTAAKLASSVRPSDISEFWDTRRASECLTIPRLVAGTNITPTAGTMYGALAIARSAFTATQIRLVLGAVWTWAGAGEFHICVWAQSARTLTRETGDIKATVAAASANTLITANLTSNLTVAAGDQFFLGIAANGQGAGSVKGATVAAAQINLAPVLGYSTTGFTGGTPGTLSTANTTLHPWIELLA